MAIDQLTEGLQSSFGGVVSDIKGIIADKPITAATIAGGIAATGIGGGIAVAATRKKSTKRKKSSKKKTSKGRSRDRKFISKQKHEIRRKRKVAGKIYKKKGKFFSRKPLRKANGKKKSRRGIHYTKNGQPYKIMANGRARFIKKRKGRR